MLLLTKANRRSLPALYEQEKAGDDAKAYVKFFTPDSSWTWYAMEFDGNDTFFGLVQGSNVIDNELGYFSLKEMTNIRGPAGLSIKRDLYFEPTKINELR